MFNKDLFLSLCKKYDVELSASVDNPMIKEGEQIQAITDEDVKRIFTACETYFGYSINKVNAKVKSSTFYLPEDYAIAC